ncbi:MAG: DUF1622 domain-containing protein [Clostridia bacterium]|nr:DUF1622 domain-containing protein [Anaerotignum sp.]NCC15247.1 DUF1622 domain-containing protein [Clostridia bacterium]
MEVLRQFLLTLTEAAILIFEFAGVGVLIIAGVRGIYNFIRNDPHTRLNLSKGMSMGLEFKLGGEILRTVIVHDLSELLIIGGIILLRGALAFMIYWSIKNEEA